MDSYRFTGRAAGLAGALGVLCGALLVSAGSRGGGIGEAAAFMSPAPGAKQESEVRVRQGQMKRYRITPADLPRPFATPSAQNEPQMISQPEGVSLSVPPGFTVSEWTRGLTNPRMLTVAPNGDVFVAESGANRIAVLRDGDSDGISESRRVFADRLTQPFGIAFYPPGPRPTHVYIANTNSVVRFPYKSGDMESTGPAETVVKELPGFGYRQHWTRNLIFRRDGKKMYVSVGSETNVSEGEDARRAAILEFNPDGTGYRIYASGLRNPVGLAFSPFDGALWTAVNERDELGDDLVPDYATSVQEGGFYGWPNYYIGPNHDPRTSEKPPLKAKTLVPDVLFEAHCAALGIAFYTARQFPAAYRNNAFVALHGSWNRSKRTGYKIVRISFGANGKTDGSYEDFVTGWATEGGKVWGRPVGVAVARDGSLLITDDGAGKIWRVRYVGMNR